MGESGGGKVRQGMEGGGLGEERGRVGKGGKKVGVAREGVGGLMSWERGDGVDPRSHTDALL